MNKLIHRLCAGTFLIISLAAGTAVPIPRVAGEGLRIVQANSELGDLSRLFGIETPSVVSFEAGLDDLSTEARQLLDVQARWLRRHPTVRIRVYGHVSATGNPAYNMALGLRRAHAVATYLALQGIEPYRLEAMVTFGTEFPADGGTSAELAGRQTTTRVIGLLPRPATPDALSSLRPVLFVNSIDDWGIS